MRSYFAGSPASTRTNYQRFLVSSDDIAPTPFALSLSKGIRTSVDPQGFDKLSPNGFCVPTHTENALARRIAQFADAFGGGGVAVEQAAALGFDAMRFGQLFQHVGQLR